jgi:hypothetical protein
LRPRDLIVVAAVVLIAGFAAADALRGRAEHKTSEAQSTPIQTTPTRLPGPQPQAPAPAGWPLGRLQGTLVFTNGEDCRIRVVDLVGGVERPLARFAGNCQLWAPPVGPRLAYGLGPASADGFSPFRIADLARPQRELGGFRALFGVVIWSQDGQRVAWCGRRHTGFDLEVGGPARRLPRCPVAYTPDDQIAYAVGNRLVVGSATVLRANGGITFVHYGTDGSLAVILDGERLERFDADGRLTAVVPVGQAQGRNVVLSPTNCAAAFPPNDSGRVTVVYLGCFVGRLLNPRGHAAAWSPDGLWLAVAERAAIAFHRVIGPPRTVRWPASAVQLAWRVR